MRQVHKAGEKLFIDYCGPTVDITNPDTGEIRTAQIFGLFLARQVTRGQKLPGPSSLKTGS